MNHQKILRRAWDMLWSYKALWLFGIILTLTTVSWEAASMGGGNNGRASSDQRQEIELPEDIQEDLDEFNRQLEETSLGTTLFAIVVSLACGMFILFALALIARYVAETGLIRMVDHAEETGEYLGLKQGIRLGWSGFALRLFLIDLLVNLPTVLIIIVLFLLALSPLLLWVNGQTVASIVGTVASIGLFFLVMFFAIVTAALLALLKHFFRRACVLEKLDVIESVRQGYTLVRQNIKDVGLMWLVMIGIELVWPMLIGPLAILLLITAALMGLLVGGLSGLITQIVADGIIPWLVAGLTGFPIFMLVMAAPLVLLGGLREVLQSTTWTLTYRELKALQAINSDTPQSQEPELTPATPR